MDDKYFSRCATWHPLSADQITVHDSFSSKAPRMITMEPWHQIIFLAADGEHTVDDFARHMEQQYEVPPAGLREQIRELVGILVGEGILRLHDKPQALPPYFAEDYFAQPAEVRAEQMRAGGYIGPAS
jgi:hypothetical protein